METTRFTLNGKKVERQVDPQTPLLWALREQLGPTGTKFGCGMALCGACTVHVNGNAVRYAAPEFFSPLLPFSRRQVEQFMPPHFARPDAHSTRPICRASTLDVPRDCGWPMPQRCSSWLSFFHMLQFGQLQSLAHSCF